MLPQPDPDLMFARAEDAEESGDYTTAERILLELRALGAARAHRDYAAFLIRSGRPEEALEVLSQSDPRVPGLATQFALAFEAIEDEQRAAEWYNRAIDRDEDFARHNAGVFFRKRARYEEALPLLEASVAREESFPSSLGHLYADMGDLDAAEECFLKSVELGDVDALVELGSVFQEAGNLSSAEAILRQAVERDADEAPEYLAAVVRAQGRREEAVAVLETAVEAGSAGAHCALADLLADSYDALGQARRIDQLYQDAIDLGDADARHNFAIWLLDSGRREEGELLLRSSADAGDSMSKEVLRVRSIDARPERDD